MNISRNCKTNTKAFTLVELLTTILILAFLVIFAIPSYKSFIEQKRLRTATEDLYNYIKASQSRGLNLPSSYYMSIQTGTNWCYGLSDSSTCNCMNANTCTVAGTPTAATNSSYIGDAVSLSTTGFNGSASNPYILFEGRRGTIAATGTITLTTASSNLSTTISANQQGLVTVCSNTVKGYPPC